MKNMLTFFASAVVISVGLWTFSDRLQDDTVVITSPSEQQTSSRAVVAVSSKATATTSASPTPTPPVDTPDNIRIDMPFASQAPTGSWDPPYDEACEEASLIIVHHYLEDTALDPTIMNHDILAMVDHEDSKGLPIDIDMFQLATVARDMYDYDAEVVEGADVTIARIEQELAQGNPVIVPLAGQDIGNPYYSGDGPPYHVLVIIGYDSGQFITHDVGTKRGANYAYDKDVIMSAIHDWNGSVDTIRSGPKRMLVVTK